jgi:hypothetical protein
MDSSESQISKLKLLLHYKPKWHKKVGAFHLERRELKPKAWVRMNKDIEIYPKADGFHPGTNEA